MTISVDLNHIRAGIRSCVLKKLKKNNWRLNVSASQDEVNPQHQNHDHYFKDVSNLKHIDVYRVLILLV